MSGIWGVRFAIMHVVLQFRFYENPNFYGFLAEMLHKCLPPFLDVSLMRLPWQASLVPNVCHWNRGMPLMKDFINHDMTFDPSLRLQHSVIVFGLSSAANEVFRQGLSYHHSDDLVQAEICYRKALTFDPQHAGAIHYLGVISLVRKNFVDALDYFESAISLCHDKSYFYNHYGIALKEVNRPEDAEKAFIKATQLDSQYADAWSNLGKLHLDCARYDKAAKAIHRAIRITPHHSDAIVHLIDLFQQTDCHDKAIQLCLHYAKSSTGTPAFRKKIGCTFILSRCYREALTLLQKLEATYCPGNKICTGSR